MKFRVASWNMNHWQRAAATRESWAYLDGLDVDIALLQECVPPAGRNTVYQEGGISQTRRWGSAVVSYGPQIREIRTAKSRYSSKAVELHQTHPGCVTVASVELEGLDPITVISAYGLIDQGYAVTTVHRILSDLTPLMDSPQGKRVILAGDLNLSTQLPPPHREREKNIFERIHGLGFVDLLAATADTREKLTDCPCKDEVCTHVRTQRHARSKIPWHNDYIYATKPLANALSAACAMSDGDPDPWALSDHCPVIAEFEI